LIVLLCLLIYVEFFNCIKVFSFFAKERDSHDVIFSAESMTWF
jgi:cold shock CspA family protein